MSNLKCGDLFVIALLYKLMDTFLLCQAIGIKDCVWDSTVFLSGFWLIHLLPDGYLWNSIGIFNLSLNLPFIWPIENKTILLEIQNWQYAKTILQIHQSTSATSINPKLNLFLKVVVHWLIQTICIWLFLQWWSSLYFMALPLKFKETLLCSLWIWKYNSVWRGTSITFNFSIPTPTVSLLHCVAGSFYYSYDVWTDTIAVPRCERLFDALTNSFLIWIAALLATLLQSNHPWPSTRLFLIP